ncbi:hypothetical protein RZS08_36685 [Arthrospira platensis SPKY1]|nr:hypothetical protein [Arthrospira platensis SPKY1]
MHVFGGDSMTIARPVPLAIFLSGFSGEKKRIFAEKNAAQRAETRFFSE